MPSFYLYLADSWVYLMITLIYFIYFFIEVNSMANIFPLWDEISSSWNQSLNVIVFALVEGNRGYNSSIYIMIHYDCFSVCSTFFEITD